MVSYLFAVGNHIHAMWCEQWKAKCSCHKDAVRLYIKLVKDKNQSN